VLHNYEYSTRALLDRFEDNNKFVVGDTTLNYHQKPLLMFMEHILCWSKEGDMIIDATSGRGKWR
jgi:hypothetical protein